MICVVDQKRTVQDGLVCQPCRANIDRWLREIADLHARVEIVPGQTGTGTRPSGKPGSREPIVIDAVDLTMPLRTAELSPIGKQLARDHGDQTGELPVVLILEQWMQIWRRELRSGGRAPKPTVPALVKWLRDRLDDARMHLAYIDEFAETMRKVHSTLRRIVGDYPAQPKRLPVPCRDCDWVTLVVRWPGEAYPIECAHCGLVYSEPDYDQLELMYAVAAARKVRVA